MWLLESPFPTTGLTNASGLAVAALSLCPPVCEKKLSLTYACSYYRDNQFVYNVYVVWLLVVSVQ